MLKNHSEAHLYILQAKKRLLNHDYSEYCTDKFDVFYVNNKRVTRNQLENMSLKVKEIMASDEFVYDPLSKLIVDVEEFRNLDDTARVRYMLELSKVYASLKKKIS